MFLLTSALFSIVASTLGGVGVIVALTTGDDTLQ